MGKASLGRADPAGGGRHQTARWAWGNAHPGRHHAGGVGVGMGPLGGGTACAGWPTVNGCDARRGVAVGVDWDVIPSRPPLAEERLPWTFPALSRAHPPGPVRGCERRSVSSIPAYT